MKRTYYQRTLLSLAIFVVSLFVACDTGDDKIVVTAPEMGDLSVVAGTLTKNSVSLKAIIASNGGADLDLAGLCWATTENPTIEVATKKYQTIPNVESYATDISDLTPSTVYNARAYARNSEGITYSKQFTFTTLEEEIAQVELPILGSVSLEGEIGKSNVMLNVEILTDGGGTISRSGFCWSITANPTIEAASTQDHVTPKVGVFTDLIGGLTPATTYYVKAYAQNSKGVAYSSEFSFTTSSVIQSLMANAGSKLLIGGTPEAPRGVNIKTDAIVDVEYNAVQIPVYPLVWDGWKDKETHNVDGAKTWTNWAKSADKKRTTVGHFLVSHNTYYPEWFTKPATPWTVDELELMLENRIKAVVEPLKDVVDIWTVVNEATKISSGKGIYRTCVWSALGTETQISGLQFDPEVISPDIPVYIRKSFELARKYAPTATLALCDAGFELSLESDLKSRAFQQLVVHLINKGTPINAVSLQCHITQGAAGFADPEGVMRWDLLQKNIKKYKDLGLKVYLSEVDIALSNKTPIVMTEEQLALQKRAFKKFVKVALDCNVDGIFFWGLGEGHDPSFRPYDCAQLYDFDHNRKPAYFGVLEALQEADLK